MSQSPVWDAVYQRYFYTLWDESNGRWYRNHHVEGQCVPSPTCASADHRIGQGWVFFDWLPIQPVTATLQSYPASHGQNDSGYAGGQSAGPANLFSKEGPKVLGSYTTANPLPYEPLDKSDYIVATTDQYILTRKRLPGQAT
jgi:hypothetical protein